MSVQAEQIQQAFSKQQVYALSLRSAKAKERIGWLKKLEKWILENREAIQDAVYADFKKPKEETDLTEILPVLSEIRYVNKQLKKWMRPRSESTPVLFAGTRLEIRQEPKGVCLILAPWNYPFNLQLMPLVSCLAAGNTAILKPSELSASTAELLVRLCREVFPPELVTIFTGDKEVAQELLKLPFNHIFFTGSPAVGKLVMEAAAKHLSGITLELGGKSPAVILPDVKMKDAADKIAWGKWTNAGQTCVAPDYILVHSSQKDLFMKAIAESIERLFVSDSPNIQQSDAYARIISDRHYSRLEEMLKEAQEKGGLLAYGGETAAEERFLAPTVLDGGADDAQIWQEEIFGPLLPVRTYEDINEVVEYVNSHPKPLAFYIFGDHSAEQNFLLEQTSAGGVGINDCVLHYLHPEMPFGGVNNSGIGKSHGYEGFREFTNAKGVLKQRIGFTSIKMVYPPYTDRVKRIINLLLRYF